jgi:hypothetical protein
VGQKSQDLPPCCSDRRSLQKRFPLLRSSKTMERVVDGLADPVSVPLLEHSRIGAGFPAPMLLATSS